MTGQSAVATYDSTKPIDLIVFSVEQLTCALDISLAQEIKCHLKVVEVPESSMRVRGVANLRGQVITIVDLRVVFGIEPKEIDDDSQILVVRVEGGSVGLLVDYVDDIVTASSGSIELPPANISGVRGEFFHGIYERDGDLACVLNLERILEKDEDDK